MKPRKEFTVLFEDLVISVAYENLYVKPVDRIAHHDPAWGIAHSHREYEVHLLMNGTGWIRSEFGDLVLHDSEICIIAPNVIHSTMQMQDDTAVWSSFRFRLKENGKTDQTASVSDSIYGELYSINMARILTVKSTEATALIEKVHEAFHLEPPFSEYKGKAWFTLLFMSLFEDLNRLPTNGVSEANKKNDRVQYENRGRMIEKYINENYNNPITVSMLAQELYLGVKQTARLVKEELHMPFRQYVLKMRLHAAKYLLQNTELTAEEIAKRIGYQSYNGFYNMFFRCVGQSPTDYRRSHAQNSRSSDEIL